MNLNKSDIRDAVLAAIDTIPFTIDNIEGYRTNVFNIICSTINDWFNTNAYLTGVYSGGVIPPSIPSTLNGTIFTFKLNLNLIGSTLKSSVDGITNPNTANTNYYNSMNLMWKTALYSISEQITVPIPGATCTIIDTSFVANTINFPGFPVWNDPSDRNEIWDFQIDTILNGLSFPVITQVYTPATCTDNSTGIITLSNAPIFV